MFSLKRNFILILFFSLLFIGTQSAYSNTPVNYHCIKDGKTCDFIVIGKYMAQNGDACIKRTENMSQEEYIKIRKDFDSKYCQPNTEKLKKYNCDSDSGKVPVYMQQGRVVAVAEYSFLSTERLQSYYDPNKCTEVTMDDNNDGTPQEPDNQNGDFNNNQNETSQSESINNMISQTIKDEMAPLDEKITSLQNEIETLKNENNSFKQNFQYLFVIIAIAFIMALIALFKANQNPYHRL